MAKFISMFNNKGGVGKTTLTWNVADALASGGNRVLVLDMDPQCNLSIAMLGAEAFKALFGAPGNSQTIRSFLQGYLQNTGPGPIHLHKGPNTHENVSLVAGDFWLNVYSDSLSVGNDLLTGNGISKFVAVRTLEDRLKNDGIEFDYVLIDLPPSFGGIVRSALYSSDYLVIPCTSDTFSEYCIGLIAQMLPQFISDWQTGVARFKANNYGSQEYDQFGQPRFGGWIFNGYDTRSAKMLRADQAHFENIRTANESLATTLSASIKHYNPVVSVKGGEYNIGNVEDMNVLVQNSLWLNVPAQNLGAHHQVKNLTGDKQKWSEAQLTLIDKIGDQVNGISDQIVSRF